MGGAVKRETRSEADRQIRFGRVLGISLCMIGFVAILVGWAGAASRDCVECQIPYLLSGGAAGLALTILGAALFLVVELRAHSRRLAERVEEAVAAAAGRPGDGAITVVAGRSTYHLPGCRLVQEREEAHPITLVEAAARRLSPCRVCGPPTAAATAVTTAAGPGGRRGGSRRRRGRSGRGRSDRGRAEGSGEAPSGGPAAARQAGSA